MDPAIPSISGALGVQRGTHVERVGKRGGQVYLEGSLQTEEDLCQDKIGAECVLQERKRETDAEPSRRVGPTRSPLSARAPRTPNTPVKRGAIL